MRIMEKAPDFVVSDALGFAVLNTFSLRPKGHRRQQEIVESTLNKCVIRYSPQQKRPVTPGRPTGSRSSDTPHQLHGDGRQVREGERPTPLMPPEADQLDPHQLHTKRNGQARQRLTVSEPSKGCAVSGSSFAGLDLRAQLPRTASRPTGGTL